jgi:hypothetical protein
MSDKQRPVAIIACRVLQNIIEGQLLRDCHHRLVFLEYGLHRTPGLMAPAIQEQIDALSEPHRVLIGYGLCGNGVVGLKARQHTLVIPRADDCIALFLGSHQEYLKEFEATPGTYYLTSGWLESGSEPLSEYREYCERFGPEDAGWISDSQYSGYQRLCFVAHSGEDIDAYRPRAMTVADFCRERWGWRYEERLGSDAFLRRLLAHAQDGTEPEQLSQMGGDFVVSPPGSEVRQDQFL